MTDVPRTIDVSKLPIDALDQPSPVWWGNTLMIFIESMTVILLLAAYFYYRKNFDAWPPPKIDVSPPIYNTNPKLLLGTIQLVLLVLSVVPMYLTDQAARRLSRTGTIIGLAVMIVIGTIASAIRWHEFGSFYFWWNDNAYGSIVWTILGIHMLYLLSVTAELLIILAWLIAYPIEPKHALDTTLCGGYWYWTAGTWVVIYATIYISPRLM
jgi:cytochrome c oxidase subunit 3